MSAPCGITSRAPANDAERTIESVMGPAPNACIWSRKPWRFGAVADSQMVCPSGETARPARRSWAIGRSANTVRTATTLPSCRMRTTVLLPRFSTYRSEPPASVVALEKLPDATSGLVAATSTGVENAGEVRYRGGDARKSVRSSDTSNATIRLASGSVT